MEMSFGVHLCMLRYSGHTYLQLIDCIIQYCCYALSKMLTNFLER